MNVTVDPKAIPEGIIKNAVAVAIVSAMNDAMRENVITDVVRAHLNHKIDTYGKETILSRAVGEAVRGMVKDALKERLETIRPKVNETVGRVLGPKFEDQVFKELQSALETVVLSNVKLTAKVYAEEYDD